MLYVDISLKDNQLHLHNFCEETETKNRGRFKVKHCIIFYEDNS